MSVLTLPEAKAHLNLTESDDDAELQTFIDAAEAAIADLVGPLAPTSLTTVAECIDYPVFTLPVGPLISVEAITSGAYWGSVALDVSRVQVDARGGVVYMGFRAPYMSGYGPYLVTYTAGWTELPGSLLLAIKELLRHLWMTQRGSGTARTGPRPADATPGVPGAAYTFPIRVEQLLRPFMAPGVG